MAALALACGRRSEPQPGPLDRVYFPTGLAVLDDHKLLVASSNADLRYDDETGGSVMALDVGFETILDPVHIAGAANVRSFAGDLAIARDVPPVDGNPDPEACGTTFGGIPFGASRAIFATRGSNTLNVLHIDASGALSCEQCGIPLSGSFADPLPVAVACGGGRARAFVAYLRAASSEAWISQYDLLPSPGQLHTALIGVGPVRGFAYDVGHDRLYMVGLATGSPTPLRWLDLAACQIDQPATAGGCTLGQAFIPGFATGLELRSIALAHRFSRDGTTLEPQRAFITGRLYDPSAAATAGGRTVDYGGVLLVVDLVENAFGGVDVQLVNALSIGRGAQDVRVLPLLPEDRPGPTSLGKRRDMVAALAVDEGELWIYDDQTGSLEMFGRCLEVSSSCPVATGAPVLGHTPYGLAVDPVLVGSTARLYVGSFAESFVTPIDVPLYSPDQAQFSGGTQHKISGGTP